MDKPTLIEQLHEFQRLASFEDRVDLIALCLVTYINGPEITEAYKAVIKGNN